MKKKNNEYSKRFAELKSRLTERDISSSATQQSIDVLYPVLLEILRDSGYSERFPRSMVDLGCGYGGLTRVIADFLGIENVYGIDINKERLKIAEQRGIKIYNMNLEKDKLPFKDGSIDLVTSFGVFEHLKFYDNPIKESYRVLKQGGWILFSIPNLGSWINRIALLLGYQPRDVEISQKKAFGIMKFYSDNSFLYHIHSATYKAIMEMLKYYGFKKLRAWGFGPYKEQYNASRLVKYSVSFIDKILSKPSLSRRIIILGKK